MDLAAPVAGILSTLTLIATLLYITGQFQQKKPPDSNETYFLDPKGPAVQFIVYRRNRQPFNLKLFDERSFRNSRMNLSKPTKIIIHGYLSGIGEEIFVLNKDAFLKMGDFNVIGMDWSTLCNFEYLSALRGVQIAGEYLAKMIDWLVLQGLLLQDLHLVGHSLGAHVAGMGGDRILSGKVARITGLDPALPGYYERSLKVKLDAGDAEMVDVIHTYMKILGYAKPLGHVDFYPNGGRFQPGCPNIYNVWKIGESLQCNHARAYEYFAESIVDPKAFKCKRCESVDQAFGENCFEDTEVYLGQIETYREGLYYFNTRDKSPFSTRTNIMDERTLP